MYIYLLFGKKQSCEFLLIVFNYSVPNKAYVNHLMESNNWFTKTATKFS